VENVIRLGLAAMNNANPVAESVKNDNTKRVTFEDPKNQG
jgi:hypothetical protein